MRLVEIFPGTDDFPSRSLARIVDGYRSQLRLGYVAVTNGAVTAGMWWGRLRPLDQDARRALDEARAREDEGA